MALRQIMSVDIILDDPLFNKVKQIPEEFKRVHLYIDVTALNITERTVFDEDTMDDLFDMADEAADPIIKHRFHVRDLEHFKYAHNFEIEFKNTYTVH